MCVCVVPDVCDVSSLHIHTPPVSGPDPLVGLSVPWCPCHIPSATTGENEAILKQCHVIIELNSRSKVMLGQFHEKIQQ